MKLLRRIRFLLHRRELDRELAEELRVHQEMRAEEGLGKRGLGSELGVRERAREAWGWMWLDRSEQDIRIALRQMRRGPGMAALAIGILALGIGANTALFSVMEATLLHPLPYAGAERIVAFFGPSPMRLLDAGTPRMRGAPRNWPQHLRTLAQVAGYHRGNVNLAGGRRPLVVPAAEVNGPMFALLGILPQGRPFGESDHHQAWAQVAIVSQELAARWGGAKAALGRTVRVDGHAMKIIGVMPAVFTFPRKTQLWLPMVWPWTPDNDLTVTNSFGLVNVARLRPGATLEQARQELIAVSVRQYAGHGMTAKQAAENTAIKPLADWFAGDAGAMLWMLLGAVGVVLLIACADVANLQLSRAVARQREIAVRAALGASRARLLRQNLTESMVLAVFGGAAGLAIAWVSLPALNALIPASLVRLAPLALDGRVLGFTAAAVLLSGCIFGLFPSLHAFGASFRVSGEKPWLRRARAALAVSEVTLALLLLAGAGLLLVSFARLSAVSPGFQPEHLLTARFDLGEPRYRTIGAEARFYQQVRERVAALPGVAGAAIGSTLPSYDHGLIAFSVQLKGKKASEGGFALYSNISPNYFQVMRIPLLAGRTFTAADRHGSPRVAVVNQAAAQAYWHGVDPIGKELTFAGGASPQWMRVVGIVGNTAMSLDQPPMPGVYLPMAQASAAAAFLVVRVSGPVAGMNAAIRRTVARVDPNEPVSDFATGNERLAASIAAPHFRTLLLGIFAALALLLAGGGIYAVMANWAARRTGEIGIRMALGAEPGAVLWLVLGEGLRLVALGLAIGLAGAFALGRVLEHFLFHTGAHDFGALAGAVALTGLLGVLACALPAWQAARLDPLLALRKEE
ncbi:MAG: ABC transporter permease [Terriglobales bacterium]